jgi:hypothetical protein
LLANRLTHLAPQPDQSELLASATVLYDPATTSNEATIEEPASADPIENIANSQTRFATRSESKTSSKNAQNENATRTSDINEFDYSTEKAADVEPVESTNNHVSVESSASNDNHKQSNQKTDDTHTAREQFQKRLQEVLEGDKRRSGRFSTALYASNLNGVGGNFNVSSNRLAQSGMVATEVLNISQGEVISIMGTGESVRVQPETKMKHHVPFTVGASLQYELTDRWAIESGVTYTYLHSTAKAEGIFTYEWSQELHYIGIPLTASYKIINRNMFDLYARAGGAVERAVAANKVFNMSAGTLAVTVHIDGRLEMAEIYPVANNDEILFIAKTLEQQYLASSGAVRIWGLGAAECYALLSEFVEDIATDRIDGVENPEYNNLVIGNI